MLKHYDLIKETVYRETLENGLKVSVVLKKGFKKTMVLFGTNFGALHQKYRINDEIKEIPQGVAHFLEHKLFANEDNSDATNQFSELGLDVNAFTDYLQTVYLFTGTSNIDQGIELLLDFVQSPYFTDENVEQEKGIICQELNMYLDRPSDRLYHGWLNNVFKDYPIKYDVGGTVEEVNKVTKEILYECYNTFYHPANMEFLVIGDVDPIHILNIIKNNQMKKEFPIFKNPIRLYTEEEAVVVKKVDTTNMEVVIPKVQVGVKLPFYKAKKDEVLIYEVLMKVILEYAFGSNTSFYQHLLDNEIISSGLDYGIFVDNVCGYVYIRADSKYPEIFSKQIVKKLKSLSKLQISEKVFERIKKAIVGSFIKALNSIEFIGYNYFDYNIKECDIFSAIDLLIDKTVEDVVKLDKLFNEEAISTFIIYPNK